MGLLLPLLILGLIAVAASYRRAGSRPERYIFLASASLAGFLILTIVLWFCLNLIASLQDSR